jgi:hypothetical protein
MTAIELRQPNPLPPITWEKLPADFTLPDEPVESNLRPLLAAALRESLELAGLVRESCLIASIVPPSVIKPLSKPRIGFMCPPYNHSQRERFGAAIPPI